MDAAIIQMLCDDKFRSAEILVAIIEHERDPAAPGNMR